jgi:hypothetical protein
MVSRGRGHWGSLERASSTQCVGLRLAWEATSKPSCKASDAARFAAELSSPAAVFRAFPITDHQRRQLSGRVLFIKCQLPLRAPQMTLDLICRLRLPENSLAGSETNPADSLGLLGLIGAPGERDALRGNKPEEPSTSCASYSARRYP